jgi:TetR/AcrR family transcriptional repressor of nem operon
MGRKGENNRQRIVDAADKLFYHRGYNQTSFQDISDETGIPRGNFYYYFKTKDDILNAVIDSRLNELTSWLAHCDKQAAEPREKLLLFTNILDENKQDIINRGCPVGTLSSELAKDAPHLQNKSSQAFALFRDWVKEQFSAYGIAEAENLAMDLLAKMQGVAILACAFKDEDFIARSHQDICDWICRKTAN